MPAFPAESFIIIGLTHEGKRFRPSDWAERLCGVMSVYGATRRLGYSPYVQPGNHAESDGAKCVFVDARIRDIEPMAYSFLLNFARDNSLKMLPWQPAR